MMWITPGISSFKFGGPPSAWSGGALFGTGRIVPQSFVAGGNESYLEFWVVTGDLQYLVYFTPTSRVF
jgi:hypothetical protein